MLVVRRYPQLSPDRLHEVPILQRLAHPALLLVYVGVIVLFTLRGSLAYSSKETWVVPLFILFTLVAVTRLRQVPAPALVKTINRYSFGIYLAHPMFFALVDVGNAYWQLPLWLYALLLVSVGMAGSIWLNRVANRLPWGGMLLGKTLQVPSRRQTAFGQVR